MANIKEIVALKELQTVLGGIDTAITSVDDKLKALDVTLSSLNITVTKTSTSTEELAKDQDKAKKASKEVDAVEKQLIQTETKLQQLTDVRTKQILENRQKLQEMTRAEKLALKATNALAGSYTKISAELSKNKIKYKELTEAQRKNKAVGGQILTNIRKQDAALKKLDSQMGNSTRHVGNYGRAIGGSAKALVGAFGLAGGVAMFSKVMKDSIKIIADFNSAQSEVQAITGASGKSLDALRNSALQLGGTTKFTATEVSKLQVEFGRLGFTTTEILQATKATLDLAAATNTDLAQAAETAGATVRAFGFSTAQTQRVVDVMAKSFSETALNMERFSTAMAILAPVAKNANVSLERTTAELGVLVNRGIDASTAATALRNIFLELSKQGLTWEQAMTQINEATDKNAVAFELFGKRGATVATVLAGTALEADNLTESFNDVNGAAETMAITMQDNLTGDTTRLKSAWEGLTLSVGQSGNVFRGAVKFFQNLVLSIGNLGVTMKRTRKLTEDQSTQLFNFYTNRAGKDAEALKGILRGYSDFSVEALDKQREAFVAAVRDTGLNKKKSAVIFEEFKILRLQQIADVTAAEEEAVKLEDNRVENEKILNEEKAANAVGADSEAQEKITAKKQKELDKRIKADEKNAADAQKVLDKMIADMNKAMDDAFEEELGDEQTLNERILEGKKKLEARIQEVQDKNREEKKIKDDAAREDVKNAATEAAIEGVNAVFDIKNSSIEKERQLVMQEKAFELELAGDNADARAKIEDKYDSKLRELKIKQAKNDKAQALFNIAINTAVAVTKTLANPVLAAIVGGLGLIQLGVVAAKPIPAFSKGTSKAPGEFIAGDAGRELMRLPSGKMQMVDQPTYFRGSTFKGSKIFNSKETEEIMSQTTHTGFSNFNDSGMLAELRGLRKDVRNSSKPIVDRAGNVIGVKERGSITKFVNTIR